MSAGNPQIGEVWWSLAAPEQYVVVVIVSRSGGSLKDTVIYRPQWSSCKWDNTQCLTDVFLESYCLKLIEEEKSDHVVGGWRHECGHGRVAVVDSQVKGGGKD